MTDRRDTATVTRRHQGDGRASEAVYSACGRYRLALRRTWQGDAGRVCYIMLNPSTATETRNDPTIERCERRARTLGFGGLDVVNLFAWRATDPRDLRRAAAPVGPGNDAALLAAAAGADLVIAGWGVHGRHMGRGAQVAALLRGAGIALHHLGVTQAGHPRHPLYVAYAQEPRPWLAED